MDHRDFVTKPRGLLIAPAGFGKTHTIMECLKHTVGKQLILTHTHAGIASIEEKLKVGKIAKEKFQVETISSYTQKYVLHFYRGIIPPQEESKIYYPFIIEKATELIQLKIIQSIIKTTYSGLFVDEYQDCTIDQHEFIMALSSILPTRLLGDPLQGIFGFGQQLVDLSSSQHMGTFLDHKISLPHPMRWKNRNEALGESLKLIRQKLELCEEIDLEAHKSINVIIINEQDLRDPKTQYYSEVNKLLNEENILLIDPDDKNILFRKKKIATFQNRIKLLEAIDSEDFYTTAQIFNDANKTNILFKIISCVNVVFDPPTALGKWFNSSGLVKKQKLEEIRLQSAISELISALEQDFQLKKIPPVLRKINSLPGVKCYRKELLRALCSALILADTKSISVYEAMVSTRNKARCMGRKVVGRCIGTTLLTKGLEFDTVIVLNAHKFDRKNLYVALTRASYKLVVFTTSPKLNPK